jgi:hypothetical protein
LTEAEEELVKKLKKKVDPLLVNQYVRILRKLNIDLNRSYTKSERDALYRNYLADQNSMPLLPKSCFIRSMWLSLHKQQKVMRFIIDELLVKASEITDNEKDNQEKDINQQGGDGQMDVN